MNLEPNCSQCRFASPVRDADAPEGAFECRRAAPQCVSDGDGVMTVWPTLFSNEWCGEFAPKLNG